MAYQKVFDSFVYYSSLDVSIGGGFRLDANIDLNEKSNRESQTKELFFLFSSSDSEVVSGQVQKRERDKL